MPKALETRTLAIALLADDEATMRRLKRGSFSRMGPARSELGSEAFELNMRMAGCG